MFQQVNSDSEVPISLDLTSVPDIYQTLNHEKRGIALLLLHDQFAPRMRRCERTGVTQDLNALKQVLEELRFEIIVRRNSTLTEVHTALNEVARRNHSLFECLMVFTSTHGYDKHLAAFDDWYNSCKLWTAFSPDKCPSLIGKPKMFFIEACRGKIADFGVETRLQTILSMDGIENQSAGPTPRKPEDLSDNYVIPTTADLLMMYSTYEGSLSWRNENGSWFFQSFCRELSLNWRNKELLDILKGICRRVAYSYQTDGQNLKQMPTIVTTLTKNYFFK